MVYVDDMRARYGRMVMSQWFETRWPLDSVVGLAADEGV